MARKIRLQMPGAAYHIYSRGNEKRDIYRDDGDREKFLEIIGLALKKFKFEIYAYVLMSNHYHIMAKIEEKNMHKIMHNINMRYSIYFNWKYKRVGRLCQDRYSSILVADNKYFMDLSRYIHLNPKDKDPEGKLDDYRWSSFPEYTGKRRFGITETGRLLKMFSESKSTARKRYLAFMAEGGSISEEDLRRGMFSGLFIGTKETSGSIMESLEKRGVKITGDMQRNGRADAGRIIDLVCDAFNVGKTELLKKRGKSNYGKRAAIYLIEKNTLKNRSEIGSMFDSHCSSVTRAIESAESELESNPEFVKLVKIVEAEIQRA